MPTRALVQIAILTAVLLLGFGVGLVLSFRAWPVTCGEAAPYQLGEEGRCLWAGWAADDYRETGELSRARDTIGALGDEAVDTLCNLAAGSCPTCRGGQAEAGLALASALGITCPADVTP